METRLYPTSISLVTYTDDPGFFAYSDTEERLPSEGFFADFESFEDSTGATFDMLTVLDADWASNAKPRA